ncbi:MAG: hypothetical protein ACM3QZ_05005 [Solirubrobacterales bacterium]
MTTLFVIMAMVLILTAIYSVNNHNRATTEYTRELRSLMEEATMVRKDLEAVLENASFVAGDMVQNLDDRMARFEGIIERGEKAVSKRSHLRNVEREEAPVRETSPHRRPESPSVPAYGKLTHSIAELRRAHPYIVIPRLFSEGYSIAEIAEILDKGKGEIKLILDIQRKREVGNG